MHERARVERLGTNTSRVQSGCRRGGTAGRRRQGRRRHAVEPLLLSFRSGKQQRTCRPAHRSQIRNSEEKENKTRKNRRRSAASYALLILPVVLMRCQCSAGLRVCIFRYHITMAGSITATQTAMDRLSTFEVAMGPGLMIQAVSIAISRPHGRVFGSSLFSYNSG